MSDGPTPGAATGNSTPESRRTARALEDRAHLALRVAWLRVHADYMFGIDTTGQTSAQLLDMAALLEVLEAEGRWDR